MRFLALVLFILITKISLNAYDKESIIKGVVLERISQFIRYKEIGNRFKICVYGNKDLAKSFKGVYKGKKYKNVSIDVEYVSSLDEVKNCNILYVVKSDEGFMNEVLSEKYKQILLVTEDIPYVMNGFMIGLYFENKKIQFIINQRAITEASLKVDYRLLKAAATVINRVKN